MLIRSFHTSPRPKLFPKHEMFKGLGWLRNQFWRVDLRATDLLLAVVDSTRGADAQWWSLGVCVQSQKPCERLQTFGYCKLAGVLQKDQRPEQKRSFEGCCGVCPHVGSSAEFHWCVLRAAPDFQA
eukprot:5169037-Amphidinium_carterae.2